MTPAQRQTRANQRTHDQRTIGQRLRRRRLEQGHTGATTANLIGVSKGQYDVWEVGSSAYPVRQLAEIAAALGVPIASLVVDELVLAEVRVSDETLERVKREGAPAADEAIARISANLKALLLAEASRPPVDLSPGARAKPRRTREQKLASWADATARSKAKAQLRRQARQVARADAG
jgi:transcriptional regulator with XRE-family HTH domain